MSDASPIIVPDNGIEVAKDVAKIASDVSSATMAALAFVKKTWVDDPESGTTITAADLNRIEDAISSLDTSVQSLQDSVSRSVDVKQDQTFPDITMYARARSGVVTVSVERWNKSGMATFLASTPTTVGHIRAGYRPTHYVRNFIGYNNGCWLILEVGTNGTVQILSKYMSVSSIQIASFSGNVAYCI